MKSTRYTLLFLVAFLGVCTLSAQHQYSGQEYCGTKGISPWLLRYQNGEIPVRQKSEEIRYIPLNVIFVGDDDGTNYPRPTRFLSALERLNSDYLDQNIQFYIARDIKYVARSRYNDHDRSGGRSMMLSLNEGGVMNTYVVENPNGNCGYYSGEFDAVALGRNCLAPGDHTWTHEVGHMLSLPHTFVGWEGYGIENFETGVPADSTRPYRPAELADGSNCETAADGFCDTGADYLSDRWGCDGQGYYPDSLTDPRGNNFAISGANYMSYALDNCVRTFSDEQKEAMLTNLDDRNLRNNLVADRTPPTGPSSVDNLDLLTPEDRERIEFSDYVEFTWSSVPDADLYVFQLNFISNFNGGVQFRRVVSDTSLVMTPDLFELDRRDTYYWRVRPVNSFFVDGDFSEIYEFRNGSTSPTADTELDQALTISPNPLNRSEQLTISARDLDVRGELQYDITDAAGRTLISRQGIHVTGNGFTEIVDASALAGGIYFVRIRIADRFVTRRIVVTR